MHVRQSIVVLLMLFTISWVSSGFPLNVPSRTVMHPDADLSRANAVVRLRDTLFKKITTSMLPQIIDEAKNITIPGQTGDHYSFESFTLSELDINTLDVAFQHPDKIHITLRNLSLAVPQTNFSVFVRVIVKISCDGEFWATLNGTDLRLTLSVSRDAFGKIILTAANSSVVWGFLNVSHKLNGRFCRVGEDIIKFFMGDIDKLIRKMAEKYLPEKIDSVIVSEMNEIFRDLPFAVDTAPNITDHSMSLAFSMIPMITSIADEAKQQQHPSRLAQPLSFRRPVSIIRHLRKLSLLEIHPRDIEFDSTSTALNELLQWATFKGFFSWQIGLPFNTTALRKWIPAAYEECSGCPLSVQVNATLAPQLDFRSGNLTFYVTNGLLGLIAMRKEEASLGIDSNATVSLFSLWVNSTVAIDNLTVIGANGSTIYFNIEFPLSKLAVKDSSIGPINAKVLSWLSNVLLDDIVAPFFNKVFKGVTIPVVDGFTLDNVEIELAGSSLVLASDVVLPPINSSLFP